MNMFLFYFFSLNLILCAMLAIVGVWTSMTTPPPEVLPRLIGTTFILGLASALGFIARFLRDVHKKFIAKEY